MVGEAGKQGKGYVDPRRPAQQAVDLVMAGPRSARDPLLNENPPYSLANRVLHGRTEAVQIGVVRAREHTEHVDTRIGDRMRARYAQEDAAKRADLIRGVGSGEAQIQEAGQVVQADPAQALGLYGKRLEAVLEGLAEVVEELPRYRSDRAAASAEVTALREELLSYRREISGVLSWIDSYKSGEAKRLEQQRQATGEQFVSIRQEVQGMKESIKYQGDETVHFFAGVVNRMDQVSDRVEEFLGVISNAYRGLPQTLAEAMNRVRAETSTELSVIKDNVDRKLSAEVLGGLTFDAVVKAASRGHSMVNYDSLNMLSGAAVQINEAAENLGERLKYLEKTQSDIRRMRKIITGMRRAAVAIGKDRQMADSAVLELVSDINSGVEKTRTAVLKAVGITTLQERERYQTAYNVLESIRDSVTGLQRSVAGVVEQSVEKVIRKYRDDGFSDTQIGQLQGVMVGGVLAAFDNMPESLYRRIETVVVSKFGEAFRGFAKALGEKGVKLNSADKREIMGPLGELTEGVTAMAIVLGEERGNVDRRLAALEKRLPTEDLLTGEGVRKIAREESGKHIVKVINEMKLGERIDGWVGTVAEAAAKKAAAEVAGSVSQAVEKAIASRPKREPRPEGEKRPRKHETEMKVRPVDVGSLKGVVTGIFRRKPKGNKE